jgi:multiple sugar transport system permease protein
MEGTKKMGALSDLTVENKKDKNIKKTIYIKRKRTTGKMLFSLFMLLIAISMLIPFVFMLSASFKRSVEVYSTSLTIIPPKPYLDNFKNLFHNAQYFIWYFNSIKVVAITILTRGFFVTMTAYAFARLRFRGKNIIFIALLATMMITPETTMVSRYLIYKAMKITDTQLSIILPATFDVFFIFMLRQFFMGIPFALTESAIIDGCSHFKVYYKIILPLAKPALVTMVLFTLVWVWNDFLDPYIFITKMNIQLLTVGLQYFQMRAGSDIALQMAGGTLAIFVPIIFFIFMQKYFIQGISSTGIKG